MNSRPVLGYSVKTCLQDKTKQNSGKAWLKMPRGTLLTPEGGASTICSQIFLDK